MGGISIVEAGPRSPRWTSWASAAALVVMAGIAHGGAMPAGAMPAESPLIAAARAGDAERVAALLDQGADPRAASPDGTTALHWAARAGQAAAVEVLLDAGSRPGRGEPLRRDAAGARRRERRRGQRPGASPTPASTRTPPPVRARPR